MSRQRPIMLLAVLPLLGACASAGHLAEYDFTDRSVAVVADAPRGPELLANDEVDLTGMNVPGALFRIGTGVAREYQAHRARPRLDSAAAAVDVSARMAGRVLEQGARQLRATPVEDSRDSEFEIEVRVRRYGIEADAWDSEARFFMEAEVLLVDRLTGRRIWKADVDEREPLSRTVLGGGPAVDDIVTAAALASLSTYEMQGALEHLADYCADRVVDKLRRGLDKARG